MATSNATGRSGTGTAQQRIADAQEAVEQTVDEVKQRVTEAAEEARDAMTELDAALREAIQERPYTALAIACGIGFLYAVARGR